MEARTREPLDIAEGQSVCHMNGCDLGLAESWISLVFRRFASSCLGHSSQRSTATRMTNRPTIRNFDFVALCLAVAVYLSLTLPHIELPGLEYDEALFVNASLGNMDGSFVSYQVVFFGKKIPLMVYPYIGAVKSFLYGPIFSAFGVSLLTIRAPMLIVGSMTLVLIYAFTKLMFGRWVALISLVLCATDPALLYATKLDWGPVALGMFFKISSLLFLFLWYQRRKLLYAISGSVLLGMGLYDKGIFAWFIIGLALATLLVAKRALREIDVRTIVLSLTFFLLACSPFLAYIVGNTNAISPSINPASEVTLEPKIRLFLSTLGGTAVYGYVNMEDPPGMFGPGLNSVLLHGTLVPLALIVCLCALGTAALGLKALSYAMSRRVLFVLIIVSAIFVQIMGLKNASGPQHFVTLLPFPQIIISYVFVWLVRQRTRSRSTSDVAIGNPHRRTLRLALVFVFLTLIVASNLRMDYVYVDSFERIGGRGIWSDAIYGLVDFCREHPNNTFVLMEWGFNTQLLALGSGTVRKIEFQLSYEHPPTQDDFERLYKLVEDSSKLFVFHAPEYPSPYHAETYQLFLRAVESAHMEMSTTKIFYQRDGAPVITVYKVAQTSTGSDTSYHMPTAGGYLDVSLSGQPQTIFCYCSHSKGDPRP